MRGAYAAGAMIELYEGKDRPFDAVWATSSGAASAAYALAGQPQGLDIWRHHLHGSRLLSFGRGLRGGPLLDLDYLIEEVFQRQVPLDVEALHASDVPLQVPVTDIQDGTVSYRDLTKEDPFPILRAAMSVPGAVHRPVRIEGRDYLDGGIVDQVPIGRALAAGTRELVCVMTRPIDATPKPVGGVSMRLATRRFPNIRQSLERRHLLYAQELAHLARPPPGVQIHVIHPKPGLRIQRWTRRRARLWDAIAAGRSDTRATLQVSAPASKPF
jgi:predicted patatin/cPLA2 family phospholipase